MKHIKQAVMRVIMNRNRKTSSAITAYEEAKIRNQYSFTKDTKPERNTKTRDHIKHKTAQAESQEDNSSPAYGQEAILNKAKTNMKQNPDEQ